MLRYSSNRATKLSLQERLQQVLTCKMLRGMLLLNLGILLMISILDMILRNMSHRVGILLLVFVALGIYVFVITWISGYWNKQTHRMQLSPIISVLIVLLALSCAIAFCQHLFWGVSGVNAYIFPICIALTTLLIAILTGIIHQRYR